MLIEILHKNQGFLLVVFKEETKLLPVLTSRDVQDRRGSVGDEAQGQVQQQQDETHQRANARASLGPWSTGFEGSSKSPVSTGMAPAPPLWAELCGRAAAIALLRGAASPLPLLHPTAEALTAVCSHPSEPGGLSPAAGLSRCGVEAVSVLPHRPWKRVPPTHRAPTHLPCSRVLAAALGHNAGPGWAKRLGAAPSRAPYSCPEPFHPL